MAPVGRFPRSNSRTQLVSCERDAAYTPCTLPHNLKLNKVAFHSGGSFRTGTIARGSHSRPPTPSTAILLGLVRHKSFSTALSETALINVFSPSAPNELSINNVEAIPKVHSLKWQKSISYSQGLLGSAPEPHLASLQALRSRQSRLYIDLNLNGGVDVV